MMNELTVCQPLHNSSNLSAKKSFSTDKTCPHCLSLEAIIFVFTFQIRLELKGWVSKKENLKKKKKSEKEIGEKSKSKMGAF